MHPAISSDLATARIADLRRQAQRDALARAATSVPSSAPKPAENRTPVSLRRAARQRRLGQRLWTLLHARVLLDGPAAAAGRTNLAEDGHRRFAVPRKSR